MVKMLNAVSNGEMWVHEDRVAEYLSAGHKLAEPPSSSKRPAKDPKETK